MCGDKRRGLLTTQQKTSLSDKDSSQETPEVSAFAKKVDVITELAEVGLSYLTERVSAPDFKINHPDPTVAKSCEEHLRDLVNVSGPDAVAHFARISGHIDELLKAKQPAAPAEKGGK